MLTQSPERQALSAPGQLEPVGLILKQLFPGVTVGSDDDDDDKLTEDQIELLEAMHERTLEERYAWPAPTF